VERIFGKSLCQNVATSDRVTAVARTLLIAPSLHTLIESLPFVASTSKGGLTLALRQVAVTTFVNLTLGGIAQSWRLLIDWGLLTDRGLLNDWWLDDRGRLDDWGLLGGASCQEHRRNDQ
jgi:hypothetical protein